ncbi:MAG: complex I subunit 5 family protein [Actinomycetota bacterium]|nr:complex I subunit 5 family protein [Actinomycetota bacterium]
MVHLEAAGPLTVEVSKYALLPFLAILAPICGAVLALITGRSERARNTVVVLCTAITFALILAMYQPVIQGVHIGEHLYKGIEFTLKGILGAGFKVDPVGLIIALITSFLWLVSSVYAVSYMSKEHARTRYAVFSLLTLAVDLGVLLARDWFSLFVFFEMLGLFSTVLVLHEETPEALDAAKLYFWFCIIGGLILLAGVLLLYAYTGQLEVRPLADLINKIPFGMRYVIASLMIVGFGAKAGIWLLHVWLPEAHPIAPTPASALLSGVMIKVGAYGILRTVNTLFAPITVEVSHEVGQAAARVAEWTTLTGLGYALIWIGVITMFLGVVNALLSANCKRMLAYHSVSQMGYIIFGLGCAAYLGKEGAMGLAGGVYHLFNHALFKAALFLSVGAVYYRTHELDMYKLGGLWRNMPFTAIACLIAVCGISGLPGFNGFASKTLLHHSILEAFEYSSHYSLAHRPDMLLLVAEVFFMLTAFGTFCSNVKMWLFVFVWKRPEKFKDVKPEPFPMRVALFALSFAILFIGLKPNWMLEKFIGPALALFGFDISSHAYHVIYNVHAVDAIRSSIPLLYDPRTLSIFGSPEVLHNLLAGGMVVLGGGMYFVLGYRFGWFHVHPPEWVSTKFWYLLLVKLFWTIPRGVDGFRLWVRGQAASYVLGAERTEEEMALKMAKVLAEQKLPPDKLKIIERGAIKLAETPEKLTQEEKFWLEKAFIKVEEVLATRGAKVRIELGRVAAAAARLEELLREERFEPLLERTGKAAATAARLRDLLKEERFEPLLERTMAGYQGAEVGYRAVVTAAIGKFFTWVRKMVLAATLVLSEERFGGVEQAIYSALDVADTRRAIRSYTRDIYANVTVFILMFVLLAACLIYVQ